MKITRTRFDSLFWLIIKDQKRAMDFLCKLLPKQIVDEIDTRFLPELIDGKVLGREFQKLECDALLRLRLLDGLTVLLILEHKSWPDTNITVQLGSYRTAIENDKRFRSAGRGMRCEPVFAIVAYHGQQKWSAPITSAPKYIFQNGRWEIVEHVDYQLIDFARMKPDDMPEDPGLRSALMMLSVSGLSKTGLEDPELKIILAGFGRTGFGKELALLVYDITNVDRDRMEKLEEKLKPEKERVMPMVGEILRNEGRQEGRLEGRQEDILLLLAQKFGKVSKARRNQVMKADKEDLDAWMGRVLKADNVDAVFGDAARN